jgi:hypothetical protein
MPDVAGMLGDEFLLRPRLSRIYYRNKYFYYPLRYFNALTGLGIWQAVLIVLSFLKWQVFPYRSEETFEQWVTNRFGKRLFETFFKSYTEKVWGIPCSELKAEWAAQRIKDLSLKTAIISMIVKPKDSIQTLIEEFHYPRFGPGMLWRRSRRRSNERGGVVRLNSPVYPYPRRWATASNTSSSSDERGRGDHRGRELHLQHADNRLHQAPRSRPAGRVSRPLSDLNHRDFLTVCLVVDQPESVPRQLDLHPRTRREGRPHPELQELEPDMVPDPSKTSLGLEYFCTEGDDLWTHRTPTWSNSARSSWSGSTSPTPPMSSTAWSSGFPRRIRSTTPTTGSISRS